MKKRIKLVIYNLIFVFALVVVSDILSLSVLTWVKNSDISVDSRKYLPTYEKYSWSDQYYVELRERKKQYKSYVAWRGVPFVGKVINVNKDGHRYTSNMDQGEASILKIAFLGGSTMWGDCVSDEYTIPSIFSKQANWQYNVENYGEMGYNAFQGYGYLMIQTLKGATPDLVITYDGVNNSPAILPEKYAHSKELTMRGELEAEDPYPFFLNISNILKPTIMLLSKLKFRFFPGEFPLPEQIQINEERNIEAAEELLDSWVIMKRLCDQIDSEFICILQPNAFYGEPNTENTSEMIALSHQFKKGYEYYSNVLELIETKKYAEIRDDFIDLSSSLDHKPNMYVDFCHLFPEGNRVIADLILDRVNKSLQVSSNPEN